jgi:putative MATE family efflux protein
MNDDLQQPLDRNKVTNSGSQIYHATSSTVVPSRIAPPDVLSGPIVPTLLRLALPTILVLVVESFVGVAETYFVSSLGTAVLAGVALVFPVLMLMQMMSNGGIGGGVSSAVARALGANRRSDAEALVWHAVVLALGFGLAFTVLMIAGAPILYRVMGGTGKTVETAVTYSNTVFAGSIPLWIVALLSSALRGAGNVKVPALISFAGAAVLIPLSPAFIFGWWPLPRLGVAGGGVAVVIYYSVAAIILIGYLRSSHSPLVLKPVRLDRRHFTDILRVGILSAIGTVQGNLTVGFVTAAVGRFGADAIAGYGIASRLDYLLIPLLFGLGTAVITMVGINVGANQPSRARRIAWTGAVVAFGFTGLLGLGAAFYPLSWLGLFSHDSGVLLLGAQYLRTIAPTYGLMGIGMTLYFASQGAKRVLWPVLAGTIRMIIAVFGGWIAIGWLGADVSVLFQIVALAAIVFGVFIATTTFGKRWGHPSTNTSRSTPRMIRGLANA